MSVNSKMTAIANAIRSLLGITGTLGLDAMATKLNSITKKAAASYTPGTANQTIAAGQYLSGAQTIKGDANLVSENIVEGKSIFGKVGTVEPAAALADELTQQDGLIRQIMEAFPSKCKVNIKLGADNSGFGGRASVTIGGTEYTNLTVSDETITVDKGTVITFSVRYSGPASSSTAIIVNGATVVSGGNQTYTYTVTSDITVVLTELSYGSGNYGYITVTTSDTGGAGGTFTPTDSGGTTYKSKFADNNVDLQAILDKVKAL